MVTQLIPVLIGTLLLLASTASNAIVSRFTLTTSTDNVSLGKPVEILIRAENSLPNLTQLDLSPLNVDFGVVAEESDLVTDNSGQEWRILLYPRQSGKFTIPSLFFHGVQSQASEIKVTPAVDRQTRQPVLFSTKINKTSVWLMQSIQIRIQIETSNRFISLEAEPVQVSGMEIHQSSRRNVSLSGKESKRFLHELVWELFPHAAGKIEVHLPPVHYLSGGVTTHLFYPPAFELLVKPLPAYVPATMPVGILHLETIKPDRAFFLSNELAYFSLKLSGAGSLQQAANALFRQLKSSESVNFYPANLRARDGEMPDSLLNTLQYNIPIKPNTIGLLTLPSPRLQYFNPDSGKIETHHYPLGKIVVINQWMMVSASVLALVLTMLLMYKVANFIYSRLKKLLYYGKAIKLIRQAEDAEALRFVLSDIAAAEKWPANMSLYKWLHHWHYTYPHLTAAATAIYMLQEGLYANRDKQDQKIRSALLLLCFQRYPILKIIP